MTTTTPAENPSTTRPSGFASSARYVALLTIAAALVGTLGAATGLIAPLQGFLLFAAAMVLGSILSLLLGAIGLLVTRARAGGSPRPGRSSALLAVGVGAVLLLALAVLAARSSGIPAIHDITTDPSDPPRFVAAARADRNQGRDLAYPQGNPDSATLQRAAYPDLAPIELEMSPEEALDASRKVATELGWRVVEVDENEGRLEATATSRIFRFVDDIVVRVRSKGNGSVVDLRSTSRVGESDLGANAARIRAFREEIEPVE